MQKQICTIFLFWLFPLWLSGTNALLCTYSKAAFHGGNTLSAPHSGGYLKSPKVGFRLLFTLGVLFIELSWGGGEGKDREIFVLWTKKIEIKFQIQTTEINQCFPCTHKLEGCIPSIHLIAAKNLNSRTKSFNTAAKERKPNCEYLSYNDTGVAGFIFTSSAEQMRP